MQDLSENVRQELVRLVPASVLKNIACFVFFDHHPRDTNNIDLTICTRTGEVLEFYQRNQQSSVTLNCTKTPAEIILYRNSKSELFYLISAGDELFALSRKEALGLYKTVRDVQRYEIIDSSCSGSTKLKIVLKSDAVPLLLDDNFECLSESDIFNNTQTNDSSPVVHQLQRKLTEAKYCVKCNEKAYKELVSLRQKVAFSQYLKQCSNYKDSVCTSIKEMASMLKLQSQTPWVKMCNKKLIIVFNIVNQNQESLQEVNVLLSNASNSLVYTTKLFTKIHKPPFWNELQTHKVMPDKQTAIVTVINLKEIQDDVLSRIEFKGMICYKKDKEEYLLPFDNVFISSLDTMGEDFDVLSGNKFDDTSILSILATTEKTDLVLRYIKTNEESSEELGLSELLCTHLQMERVVNYNNVIIHRKSPYHILNGVMIVFQNNDKDLRKSSPCLVSVYTRTSSQVLALIHHIYDSIPHKIIATAPNHKLTAKREDLSHYNEEIHIPDQRETNYLETGSSVLKKLDMVLEYLDSSMIKMSESKDPLIQSKIGSEIDLLAQGVDKYVEFRDKLLEEHEIGADISCGVDLTREGEESMVID